MSKQIEQKLQLLNNFGSAIRGSWGGIDGRWISRSLGTFVSWVADDNEPFNRDRGLDILGVCQGCGLSWEGDCYRCEGEQR